jgi:molecular chaperone DnaK
VGYRGEVKIEVTFEINTDGIVNVSAADTETGQKTSTTISLSSGLTEADIQRSILQNRQTRLARGTVHAVPPGTSRDVLPDLPSAVEG